MKEATNKFGQEEFTINVLKNSGLVNAVNLLTLNGIQSVTCDMVLTVMQGGFLPFIANPVTGSSTVYPVKRL